MQRAVELACRVARSNVSVLITGPNGAGKERIAQIVHANSAQRAGPFVAVNCGAIPAELIEAELFGAEAGRTRAPRAPAPGASRRLTAARCSWTRSATSRWPVR